MIKERINSTLVLILIAGLLIPISSAFADDEVALLLPGEVKLELVRIPAGSFQMGSPGSERGRSKDEGPVHTVKIDYDFYMGKYEVTQAQWMSLMDKNPAYRYGIGDNYPVSHVSWDLCQQFVGKLNRLGIGNFRLPTEAEWEYACRAGTQTRFYFGDSLDAGDTCDDPAAGTLPGKRSDYMWYCGDNGLVGNPNFGAKPVGQRKPNGFGLYDMHGNVWEWCLDQYHPNYEGAPTDGRLRLDWAGAPRVLRGGGWDYHALNCRSAVRNGYSANRGYTFHGMRLVWLPYERKSEEWFKSWEAEVIGDNLVSYQTPIGAWPKNMRMESHGYQGEKFTKNWATSIDNGATVREMTYMAKLYYATGKKRFKESFNKGLDWLLEAQYDNGGWPQRYPLTRDGDYGDYITFNDDAMTGTIRLMRHITENADSGLVDSKRLKKVKKAHDKGMDCLFKCQVIIDGRRTVWGQQHDPVTLLPKPGREYEPVAVCGRESAGVISYLMSIDNPPKRVIDAIESAVAWFESSKITGIRIANEDGETVVVRDANAPALWARFYEIESGRPIFGTYDGKVKYSIEEIVQERRTGYGWYGRDGERVFAEYPKWKNKVGRVAIRIVEGDEGLTFYEGKDKIMFYQRKHKSLNGTHSRANYIHPLYGLDGEILTEDFPDDHKHHRGIFWAWHQVRVNGKKMGDNWSTKEFIWDVTDAEVIEAGPDSSALKVEVIWKSPAFVDVIGQPKPIVKENTIIRAHRASNNLRKIDFEISLLAIEDDVLIGGSENARGYGGFSTRIRLPEGLVFTDTRGPVEPRGVPVFGGPWMDFSGKLGPKGKISGLAVLTQPLLPDYRQPWILRRAGSCQNPVFPGYHPVPLSTEEPLVLRYRLIVHRGDASQVGLDKLQAEYVEQYD